jgi:archaemetzincin
MKKSIYLQQIGELDRSILRNLKKNLKWTLKKFNTSIEIVDDTIPLTNYQFNPIKKQYNADLVMQSLFTSYKKEDSYRILGILDHDIYASRFNFIFGSAKNPAKGYIPYSPVALISVFRLREEFYGLFKDQALFELRVLKEALHELGHTFGLIHCEKECVMYFSNSIEDTDRKPPKFCEQCMEKLERFFRASS